MSDSTSRGVPWTTAHGGSARGLTARPGPAQTVSAGASFAARGPRRQTSPSVGDTEPSLRRRPSSSLEMFPRRSHPALRLPVGTLRAAAVSRRTAACRGTVLCTVLPCQAALNSVRRARPRSTARDRRAAMRCAQSIHVASTCSLAEVHATWRTYCSTKRILSIFYYRTNFRTI